MTNEELKKKIKEILRKRMTELLGSCHTDEIPLTEEGAEAILFHADEFADALISAGIGYVKDLQAKVDVLEITNIALQAGYDGAEEDRLYWVNKYKEAEHRAGIAERALLNLCVDIQPYSLFDQTPLITEASVKMQEYLQQAERELAEERKND